LTRGGSKEPAVGGSRLMTKSEKNAIARGC
jgi:hypothetical protein